MAEVGANCYAHYNEDCVLEIPIGAWEDDGYEPYPGLEVILWPPPQCIDTDPKSRNAVFDRLYRLGFSKFMLSYNSYFDIDNWGTGHIAGIQEGFPPPEDVLLSLPLLSLVTSGTDDPDLNALHTRNVLDYISASNLSFYCFYLDEPRVNANIIYAISEIVHQYNQRLVVGTDPSALADFIPLVSTDYDEFKKYVDGYAYTSYSGSWGFDWLSGGERDQTGDWCWFKRYFRDKFWFPWIETDYYIKEETLENLAFHSDYDYLDDYLYKARNPCGGTLSFSSVGCYASDIITEQLRVLEGFCSYIYENPNRIVNFSVNDLLGYLDRRPEQELLDSMENVDVRLAIVHCLCERMDIPLSKDWEYFREDENCTGLDLSFFRQAVCSVFWARMERFSQAAFRQKWLRKKQQFRVTGTEVYYCQYGDCSKCRDEDGNKLNLYAKDPYTHRPVWSKVRLPNCPHPTDRIPPITDKE